MKRPRKHITVRFGVTVLLVALIAVASYRAVSHLRTTADWVWHTDEALVALRDLASAIQDEQSQYQGYVITGNQQFLRSFHQAINTIDERVDTIRSLTAGSADQQRRLRGLALLIAAVTDWSQHVVETRETQGLEAATALIRTERGAALVADIRAAIHAMEAEERGLLEMYVSALRTNYRSSTLALSGLVLLAFGFLFSLYYVVARDIADRKQAARVLRESEERYRVLTELSPDAVVLIGTDARIITCNQETQKLFGVESLAEVVGRNGFDFIAPEDHQQAATELQLRLQGSAGLGRDVEHILLKKDGTRFSAELRISALSEDGKVIGLISVVRDMTERKRAEEELERSLSLLRATLESTADGILVVDREQSIVDYNQRFIEMWRIPPDIIASGEDRVALTFVADQLKDPNSFLDKVRWLYDQPAAESYDTLEFKDGRVFERFSRPQQIGGRIVGRVWSFRDVTDRWRAEERAQKSSALLEAIRSAESQFIAEAKTADVFNGLLDSLLRLTESEYGFIGETIFPGSGPPYLKTRAITNIAWDQETKQSYARQAAAGLEFHNLHTLYGSVITTGEPVIANDPATDPRRGGASPGHPTLHAFLGLPLHRGEKLVGMAGVANRPGGYDHQIVEYLQPFLTACAYIIEAWRGDQERRRAEEALRESEAGLRMLIEGMPAILWTTDAEIRVTSCSGAGLRLLDIQPSQVQGMSLYEYFRTDDPEATPIAMHLRALKGEPVTFENIWMGRTFACHVEPRCDPDGKVIGTIGIADDVTRDREAQRALEQQTRLAAVGQLAAGIAHDFNNILSVVIGLSELLKQDSRLHEDLRPRLDVLVEQGHRGSRLIRQILDFSRRSPTGERQRMDLSAHLAQIVRLIEFALPEHVALKTVIEAGEHLVRADPAKLEQALTNLVINARDAMPEGGDLQIRLSRLSLLPGHPPPVAQMSPGDWVVLSVSDIGTGMPPEVVRHAFEPFFTTKEPGAGTGLGLAQVYGLVQQHGGFTDLSSEVGIGTTCTIYLPAETGTEQPAPPMPRQEPATEVWTDLVAAHGKTILLVEDDRAVREVTNGMLEGLGYHTLQAQNCEEALQVYLEHRDKIFLVLMDLVMPGMGGETFHSILRQYDSSLPLIMLSGYPLRKPSRSKGPDGITAWLQKPVDREQLAHAVRRALTRNGSGKRNSSPV